MLIEYIENRLLKPRSIEKRQYQVTLADKCFKENLLVVLPTGLGKTTVALLTISKFISINSDKQYLFLAPTKPLTNQHYRFLKNSLNIDEENITLITGEVPLKTRKSNWTKKIICATPQIACSDISKGLFKLSNLALVIFDEVHRAVGNYAYVKLNSYITSFPNQIRIIGLTASLPHQEVKIKEIMKNLSIEKIDIKTNQSPDVIPFMQKTDIEWIKLVLPDYINKIRDYIKQALNVRIQVLKKHGLINTSFVSHSALLKLRTDARLSGNKVLWKELLNSIRLNHALNLIETQSVYSFVHYFEDLFESWKGNDLKSDDTVLRAYNYSISCFNNQTEHPKINKLKDILLNLNDNDKVIVFTSYRASVEVICEHLKNTQIKFDRLIGKAGKTGQNQKKQASVLEGLQNGEFNVLIATQIGEEGLDVAECNHVIFYDNVPSAIRYVQRSGRTGRNSPGKILVLMSEGTRDEAYYWSAIRKMKTTANTINNLDKTAFNKEKNKEKFEGPLDKYVKSTTTPVIYVDSRENISLVNQLKEYDITVEIKTLSVGDIIISEDVVIERKKMGDFAKSLIDGRLFKQLISMKNNYVKPVLIIEGNALLGSISKASYYGVLASIIGDFEISIITTKDERETSEFIYYIARREQLDQKKDVKIRFGKKPSNINEIQKYVVAGIPGINTAMADKLLKKFRNLQNLFNADIKTLTSIDGVGNKTSSKIKEISTHDYDE